jgi:LTXXQ motif family protein
VFHVVAESPLGCGNPNCLSQRRSCPDQHIITCSNGHSCGARNADGINAWVLRRYADDGRTANGGMPMMGMMQMMMGRTADHVDGRIAFLKTELKITDAQQPLWNAVGDAMRASAKDMAAMMPMMQSMMQPSGTLPEKLAGRENAMTAHLEALRKLKSAIDPLYAALSDEQKKTADQLIVGPMGIRCMGMM